MRLVCNYQFSVFSGFVLFFFSSGKEYVVEKSNLTHEGPLSDGEATRRIAEKNVQPVGEKTGAEASAPDGAILFATATCPNCRIACTYLDKAGYAYTKLLADEHADLAMSLGVKQAPTLLVPDENGGYAKYAGAGAIKGFLENLK